MARWQYTKGLHSLGNNAWAYLQPDGGWGWSNAGLVIDGEESLLVDTLFDEHLTADMLARIDDATGLKASDITTLVNTHANGDHTYGNSLVDRARIIASEATAEEMQEMPPERLAEMMKLAPQLGDLGSYLEECFAPFDFEGVRFRLPDETFKGQMTVTVGDKDVHLIEVGPAHTKGDTLVHVPQDKLIYTGDILFIDGTPVMWAGTVHNWIRACERILDLDVETIVPGHGPVTDKSGVRRVLEYLTYIDAEARKRYEAGLSVQDAAHDIALGDFDSWIDAERIAVNVATLYREYSGQAEPTDVATLFALMSEIAHSRRH